MTITNIKNTSNFQSHGWGDGPPKRPVIPNRIESSTPPQKLALGNQVRQLRCQLTAYTFERWLWVIKAYARPASRRA